MKILMVDNNPKVLHILTGFLEQSGHETRTATDGLSALHVLDEFTPDVVITDLVMPNIGGDKLCRIIRDLPRLNRCFIIILSAIAAEGGPEITGADACIAKGKTADVKKHLLALLERAGQRKSDRSFEVDLTLGLDQLHNREVTRELLDSRDYFAGIVEHLDEGVFGLNRDGLIIYANRAAAHLTGLAEERLLARDFVTLFAENDRAAVRRGLQNVNQGTGKEPQQIDHDPPLSLNGYFVVLKCLLIELGEQQAIVVMMQDQSARVIGAKTLSAGEIRWRTLFEQIPGGALLLENSGNSEFVVRAANRAAADRLGKEPRQLTGRPVGQLWPAADQGELNSLLQRVRRHGQTEDLTSGGGRYRCCPLPSGELILLLKE